MPPVEFERTEFFETYWDYRAGEHASFIYPTQKGKSHLMWQALGASLARNPDLSAVTLMPKAKSPSTSRWAASMNFREIPSWPPRRKLFGGKPAGYVVWPPHRRDLTAAEDRAQVAAVLREALHARLWEGNGITVADDLHILALMGLSAECEEMWTTGGEGGAGLWGANQKPSGTKTGSVSSFFYNCPSHLFLGKDTDHANVQRFSEIGGGINPAEVARIVRNLKLYRIGDKTISQVLYIDMRIPAKCLIGP
jgi:hypothetical protein